MRSLRTSAARTWRCRWNDSRPWPAANRCGSAFVRHTQSARGGDRADATGASACAIVDTGHIRARDLAIELPPAPLEAVMSGEVWQQMYDRLGGLGGEHRATRLLV